MTRTHDIALMASLPLPAPDAVGVAPDWIHLLPAPQQGGLIHTQDARGPYRAGDPARIIAASFARTDKIEVDLNHATYLAAPRGERSDAYGWITEMQAREDGIWGHVEWTDEGARLVSSKAYRGISPAIRHDAAKNVLAIENASLVNRPNFRGMTALNQEGAMTLMQKLAEMLGLGADATEDQVLAALKGKLGGETETAAMQAQLVAIGTALGVAENAGAPAVLAAAKAAKTSAEGGTQGIAALQAEVAELTNSLNAVTEAQSRAAAEAFVDGEIQRGRAGVKPLRDHYVSMHMQDPARVAKELGALPVLAGGTFVPAVPPAKDGEISLNAEQHSAARLLGIPAADYAATLRAERAAEEIAR